MGASEGGPADVGGSVSYRARNELAAASRPYPSAYVRELDGQVGRGQMSVAAGAAPL
ncbi:MAG TPA: hypothetical protein VNQ77_00395 [Frankiaceae bacterium]|nr:hypothetical protein [Frankiaceae bacterium]